MSEQSYRLALDVGTISLGWAVVGLSDDAPSSVIATGVRIFAESRDAQSKSSFCSMPSAQLRASVFDMNDLEIVGSPARLKTACHLCFLRRILAMFCLLTGPYLDPEASGYLEQHR